MNCWCRNQIQGQLVLRAKYIMIQRTNQSSSLQENQWILTIRCYQINKSFNACVPYICNCLSSVYTTIKVARKSCVQRFRETRRKACTSCDKDPKCIIGGIRAQQVAEGMEQIWGWASHGLERLQFTNTSSPRLMN